MSCPSVAVVDETCRAACKAMKLQARQLLMLSASYAKLPFENSGQEIFQVLTVTMDSIQKLQKSLTTAAERMKGDLGVENQENEIFPQTLVVTVKEYAFLNAVFQEYTTSILDSSENFSLFSTHSDIGATARQSCRDNAEKLNDSSKSCPSLSTPKK